MPPSRRSLPSPVREAILFAGRRYPTWVGKDHWDLESQLTQRLPRKSHLTSRELIDVARWKSGSRTLWRVRKNSDETVRAVTRAALSCERVEDAIDTLVWGVQHQRLEGVSYPTASCILMFHDPTRFTVLDSKVWGVLDMLGYLRPEPSEYSAGHYLTYLTQCKEIARGARMNLRQLDRGLWMLGGSDWIIDFLKTL